MTQTNLKNFELTETQRKELEHINKLIDLYNSKLNEAQNKERLILIIKSLERDKGEILFQN
jgi:DNA-binding PadR family transcriptional regulator